MENTSPLGMKAVVQLGVPAVLLAVRVLSPGSPPSKTCQCPLWGGVVKEGAADIHGLEGGTQPYLTLWVSCSWVCVPQLTQKRSDKVGI